MHWAGFLKAVSHSGWDCELVSLPRQDQDGFLSVEGSLGCCKCSSAFRDLTELF